MSQDNSKKGNNFFIYILLTSVLIVILSSFYSFYLKKNYDFFIETECNPNTDTCFYRDCENNPDECPLNNLSFYNQYTIKAKDFSVCRNEDCKEACGLGLIKCVKTECTETDINDGLCVEPYNLNSEN